MKAKCFACKKSVLIGSGHYMICQVRIKMDQIDQKNPKLFRKIGMEGIRLQAIKELKNDLV